jgi:demethylspheroidene O-methyltransferase
LVRRDGEALFDLVAGFCHSQILAALVTFDIPEALLEGPQSVEALARQSSVPPDRMRVLLRGGVALGLLRLRSNQCFALTRKGAALTGVPGLRQMILHHAVLYRDLADPAAFFRDGAQTELAAFWPYVFGRGADPQQAQTYSDLMADSQTLVAEDTLSAVSLTGVRRLLDIGGGTGAFLSAACRHAPDLQGVLFDLPAVVDAAKPRIAKADLTGRIACVPGSFRDDPLPEGADAMSLVRVLYDHTDDTVAALLAKIFAALPSGGRLIVSEPMTGGDVPSRAGDAYFALYTLAMGTGRTRSPEEIAKALTRAGFGAVEFPRSRRPFVTSVVSARKS